MIDRGGEGGEGGGGGGEKWSREEVRLSDPFALEPYCECTIINVCR